MSEQLQILGDWDLGTVVLSFSTDYYSEKGMLFTLGLQIEVSTCMASLRTRHVLEGWEALKFAQKLEYLSEGKSDEEVLRLEDGDLTLVFKWFDRRGDRIKLDLIATEFHRSSDRESWKLEERLDGVLFDGSYLNELSSILRRTLDMYQISVMPDIPYIP